MRTLKDFTVLDYGDIESGSLFHSLFTNELLGEETMLCKEEFKESAFQDIGKYNKVLKGIEKRNKDDGSNNHGPIYWITVGHIEYIKKKFNITGEDIKQYFKTGDKNDKN